MELSKRDYIDKLKRELDVVEDKWQMINNENCMVGEDYRSRALSLFDKFDTLNQVIASREAALLKMQETIDTQNFRIEAQDIISENQQMYSEELLVQI
jgi:hypothetical protein